MEAEVEVLPLMKEDLEPRNTGSLWRLEETRAYSLLAPRGTQSCQ